jgi:hypothetical protein
VVILVIQKRVFDTFVCTAPRSTGKRKAAAVGEDRFSSLSIAKLKSLLSAAGVQLPVNAQKKPFYLDLARQHADKIPRE